MLLVLLTVLLALACYADDACDECSCYRRKGKMYVDCSGMGLDTIPDNIPTDVHHLLLQGNNFADLGTTTTFGAAVLDARVIFLMNNPIASVTSTFFAVTPRVHTLMLHHTELAVLPTGVFNVMPKMKWLWLNNNQIHTLPRDAFTGMKQIREIYLFNNSITTVPNGAFRDQAIIKHLYLFENNIPTAELDCCQLCGVPEPVDVKWGLIPIDTELKCGYNAPVNCNFGSGNVQCYPIAGETKGQTYIFSGAGRGWVFAGLSVIACVVLSSVALV